MGRPEVALSRIGSRRALSRFTVAWQFMHALVGGTFATGDTSTEAWQYRQSRPSSPTWSLWL